MKYRFLILLAVAGVLAACTKEESGTSESGVSGKVVAQFGAGLSDVKTTLGPLDGTKRKIFWAEGDCIAINGIVSNPLTEEAAGGVTALFDFTEYLSTPCDVLYPASMYKDEATITLPAIQTYQADGFKSDAYPMSARSESTTGATLSPLCAMIKFPIKLAGGTSPDTDRISNIVFSGNDGEQVCGDFSINYDFALLTSASSAEEDKKVMININKSLDADPLPVVMVVPAGDYDSGFSIRVTDVAGHYMDMSKNTAFTVEAGHLYVMPEFEFVPTGTQLGIEISSADDLIAFAQNYNSKAIASEGLIATLTQNIAFDATSSAAFNATGGIGLKVSSGDAEDYYFNGLFNGNGMTISGLQATVPLFKAVGGAGIVQDFSIDGTCSFNFTHHNSNEADLGSVIGYHKGALKQVSVDADVAISADNIEQVTALGAVVGRVTEGLVQDCSYSGDLSVPYEFVVDTKKTYIGGLVGSVTNEKGKVLDSTFEGTIDFAGTVASSDKNNPYLMIGGIVGSVNAGLVSGCTAKGTATKEIVMDNDKSYVATIQNHTRKAYHVAQGGIVGQNAGSVMGCTNEASIKSFVLGTATKGGTNADGNSRYYDLGGIVGLNLADATVSDCINNAPIETRCTPRIQKIGGVVGYNRGGEVTSCSNTAVGSIYITTTNISSYSLRVGEVGGVIGNNDGLVSDIQNAANISVDRTENAAGVELKFGGVIGLSTKDVDGGEGKSISNSGNITDSYNGVTVTTVGLRFGGVVGSTQASVRNVTNSGKLTFTTSSTNVVSKLYMGGVTGEIRDTEAAVVSGCVNTGEVLFDATQNAAHTDNYAGGIIGKTVNSNVIISDCVNSGYIHGGNGKKNNGTTFFVGGIVAYLDGVSSIDNCENNGVLLNNQFNNTVTKAGSTFEGGIAGFVLGTADNRIPISNVTNNVNEGASITGGRRGYVGGAVGYGEYVDISEALNTNSYGGGSGYYVGGLAGWLLESTVSGSFLGTSIETSQLQNGGGIVAKLDAGSIVTDCSSSVSSFIHSDTNAGATLVAGAIAGSSALGSTIQNCHYKASGTVTNDSSGADPASWAMAICSDGNFTDGGGNVADL